MITNCLKIIFFSCSFLIFFNLLKAQTGPGGVGNSATIEVWLDASELSLTNGNPVSTWTDLSTKGNDLNQINGINQPTFNSTGLNSKPTIVFDGNNDYMDFPSDISTSSVSIITVAKSKNSTNGILIALNKHAMFTKGASFFNPYVSPTSFNVVSNPIDQFGILTITTNSGSSSGSLYQGTSTTGRTIARTSLLNIDTSSVGMRKTAGLYNTALDGEIAEMIVLNNQIRAIDVILVKTYLAAKYNLPILNNFYKWRTTHHNGVIGVGYYNGTTSISARGRGNLLMDNASSLNSQFDFMTIGHDDLGFGTNTSSLPIAVTERWNQTWRVNKLNKPGTIDLEFFLETNGFAASNDSYVLLIDSDGDFSTGATLYEGGRFFDVGNNSIKFTGVDFNDGDYFTLAEKNSLPVAIASGNWESTSTWSCGCIPDFTSDIIIPSPFTVTINELANAKSILVDIGATLVLAGNDTLQITEDFDLNGVLNAGSNGTIMANGSSAQTFTNNSGTNVQFVNLVVSNSSGLSLIGGWSLEKELDVTAGTLDVSGADSLVLISNVSSTAQILQIADGSLIGDFTVQRFIDDRNAGFGLISSPIDGATLSELDDNLLLSGVTGGRSGNSLNASGGIFYTQFGFDRDNNNQRDTLDLISDQLRNGEGYEVYLATTSSDFFATTVDFVGTPNDGNIVPRQINSGFNLMGNPYQSFIGFDNLDRSNIDNVFYLFDTDAGSYITVNGGTGGTIAPGQGFWVNRTPPGTTTINFEESDKVSSNASTFVRKKNQDQTTFKLKDNSNNFYHSTKIKLNFDAKNGLDEKDARYLPSPITTAPGIYFSINDDFDHLVQNSIEFNQDEYNVDVAIEAGTSGSYTIVASNIQHLASQFKSILLYDKISEEVIDLNLVDTYQFESDAGKSNRFKLVLSNTNKIAQEIQTVVTTSSNLRLINKQGLWFVDYQLESNEQFTIAVYNLNGQLVKNIGNVSLENDGSFQIQNLDNLKGVYLLQIKGTKHQINQTIKF